jgi:hypothetical protein
MLIQNRSHANDSLYRARFYEARLEVIRRQRPKGQPQLAAISERR